MLINYKRPLELIVLIKGGGEIASGITHKLAESHFKVCLTELPQPLAVRREVSFSEAIYEGEKEVEGIMARLVKSFNEIAPVWNEGKIPILIDPEAKVKDYLKPGVVVDARVAKRNLGTKITEAPMVIGVGPGFTAGIDVHVVIETNRGHYLGRIIRKGEAEKNTGIPGEIMGIGEERVLRAPGEGVLQTQKGIGDYVQADEVVGKVGELELKAMISGVIRGLLRNGSHVWKGMKAGDIDPRGVKDYCYIISDKSRAVAGGVLEAILSHYNG